MEVEVEVEVGGRVGYFRDSLALPSAAFGDPSTVLCDINYYSTESVVGMYLSQVHFAIRILGCGWWHGTERDLSVFSYHLHQ